MLVDHLSSVDLLLPLPGWLLFHRVCLSVSLYVFLSAQITYNNERICMIFYQRCVSGPRNN